MEIRLKCLGAILRENEIAAWRNVARSRALLFKLSNLCCRVQARVGAKVSREMNRRWMKFNFGRIRKLSSACRSYTKEIWLTAESERLIFSSRKLPCLLLSVSKWFSSIQSRFRRVTSFYLPSLRDL